MKTVEGFEKAFADFVDTAEAVIRDHYETNFPRLVRDKYLTFTVGRKYAKLVETDKNGDSRGVYCFVDMTNGDVLKAATWSKPETNKARSSIFDDDHGASGIGPYGAKYLK